MLTGSLHQFQANSSVDLTILATDLATGILCKALVRVPIVTAKRPPNFPFPTYLFETGCLVHNQLIGRIQVRISFQKEMSCLTPGLLYELAERTKA